MNHPILILLHHHLLQVEHQPQLLAPFLSQRHLSMEYFPIILYKAPSLLTKTTMVTTIRSIKVVLMPQRRVAKTALQSSRALQRTNPTHRTTIIPVKVIKLPQSTSACWLRYSSWSSSSYWYWLVCWRNTSICGSEVLCAWGGARCPYTPTGESMEQHQSSDPTPRRPSTPCSDRASWDLAGWGRMIRTVRRRSSLYLTESSY